MSISSDLHRAWRPYIDALHKVDETIRSWADRDEHQATQADATFGGWSGYDLRERLAIALLEAQGYLVWDVIEDTESPPPGWSMGDVLAHHRPGAQSLRDDNGDWWPWVAKVAT